MPAPRVRGDYDQLGKIASAFGAQADASKRTYQQVKSQMDVLQGGDWIGKGARAFYKEMEQDVLPALNRLVNALNRGQQVTLQISRIIKEAEEAAARLLRGAGADGSARAFGPASPVVAAARVGAGGENGGTQAASSLEPLTVEQLRVAMPGLSQERAELLLPHLNSAMEEFDINTPERRRMFLAQISHESRDLTRFRENMNYTRERLLEVFPGRFTEETAADYAGQPQRTANYVYANRMGNGDEASGDGWRYRGRGGLHITGRAGYEAAGTALGLDLVNHPELLEQPEHAIRSAAWWWQEHGLNERVDANPTDVDGVSRVINPGGAGLQDRRDRFDRITGVPEH